MEKNVFVKDFKAQDCIRTTLLVRSKELQVARNGKPYLALTLMDRTGSIDSRVWENAEALAEQFMEGDVVAVAGRASSFQNRLQLIVEHLVPLSAEEVVMEHYLPASSENLNEKYAQLVQVFEQLDNRWVRELALALLNDPDIAKRYKFCPAAKTIHHAYIGGLLCHSLHLTRLVDAVLPLYPGLNRDILMFGAAFHDFGKIYELCYQGPFGYTDEGKLVGHIAIAVSLVDRKIQAMPGFPPELEWHLKHLILSHHGKLEYGSPKRPATLEADVLHCLDHMDSRIESIQGLLAGVKAGTRWSAYHKAYDQYYWKAD